MSMFGFVFRLTRDKQEPVKAEQSFSSRKIPFQYSFLPSSMLKNKLAVERINVKFCHDRLNLALLLFPLRRSCHRGPLLLWRGQRAAGGARGGWRPTQWRSLAPGAGRAQRQGGVAPTRPVAARHQGGAGPRPHPPATQQPAVHWFVCGGGGRSLNTNAEKVFGFLLQDVGFAASGKSNDP